MPQLGSGFAQGFQVMPKSRSDSVFFMMCFLTNTRPLSKKGGEVIEGGFIHG